MPTRETRQEVEKSVASRTEDRLSVGSAWLATRRSAGARHLARLHSHLESARRKVRSGTAHLVRCALARAREAADEVERDMERDYGAAPRRPGFRREELEALRRHLQLTAALLPHLSNLDDPAWRPAHEAYERSWDELYRAFEGAAAAPVERG